MRKLDRWYLSSFDRLRPYIDPTHVNMEHCNLAGKILSNERAVRRGLSPTCPSKNGNLFAESKRLRLYIVGECAIFDPHLEYGAFRAGENLLTSALVHGAHPGDPYLSWVVMHPKVHLH